MNFFRVVLYLFKKATDPTGAEGGLYWNSTSKKLRVHNGTSWSDVGSGGGGAAAPSIVRTGTTFSVPVDSQVLFSDEIDMEDGAMISFENEYSTLNEVN